MSIQASAQGRPSGALSIAGAFVPFGGRMNDRLAAHLLRRAGFGGSPAQIARFAALSPGAAVDELINFPATGGLAPPPQFDDPFLGAGGNARGKEANAALRRTAVDLQTWWLERMIATPAPLQEKMTLFWHGHFPSAYRQKRIGPTDVLRQNNLFRTFALGNIRDLTQAVSRDPAMLKYLDNRANVKAHPNENYARELMELFTLGIGNYTETDIRESARAFTGWTVDRLSGEFKENERTHDDGVKTFLGRTGDFEGSDIVSIIFEQPACAKWFAYKLLSFFVYNDPEPELVAATAALIRKYRFELRPVLSTVLRSEVFFSDRAYRALVKSPVEFVVGTYKLLGIEAVTPQVLGALARMGQTLFVPPSVKGWDGGAAWLSTNTLLTRENFVSGVVGPALASGDEKAWLGGMAAVDAPAVAQRLVTTILQGDVSPSAREKIEGFLEGADTSALGRLSGENFEERLRGATYLTMATPAYQLN